MTKLEEQDDGFAKFMAKIPKTGINRGLSMFAIIKYLKETPNAPAYLVSHGSTTCIPIDAFITSFERINDETNQGIVDYMLTGTTGTTPFVIPAKVFATHQVAFEPINFSRFFITAKERDEFYDDILYLFFTNSEYTRHRYKLKKDTTYRLLEEKFSSPKHPPSPLNQKPEEDPSSTI